jgi:hypothetical protein
MQSRLDHLRQREALALTLVLLHRARQGEEVFGLGLLLVAEAAAAALQVVEELTKLEL